MRVGAHGDPVFYQFESPLLRLMLDHDYRLFVKGGQAAWLARQPDGAVDPATVWVHRFYDVSASTFGQQPQGFQLERAAADLLSLVELVRRTMGAPRVHLVAHSMGGLVCRPASGDRRRRRPSSPAAPARWRRPRRWTRAGSLDAPAAPVPASTP